MHVSSLNFQFGWFSVHCPKRGEAFQMSTANYDYLKCSVVLLNPRGVCPISQVATVISELKTRIQKNKTKITQTTKHKAPQRLYFDLKYKFSC